MRKRLIEDTEELDKSDGETGLPTQRLRMLFEKRHHGASNVRGIDFQLLVAVDRALELFSDSPPRFIRLEGLEDIDVHGEVRRCVQAKCWQKTTWSHFRDAFQNYCEILEEDRDAVFEFVVAGKLGRKLEQFAHKEKAAIDPGEWGHLVQSVRGYCPAGMDAEEVLEEQVEVTTISRDDLWSRLVERIVESFGTSIEGAELHLFYVISKFLEWSGERGRVDRDDMNTIRDEAKTAAARETGGYQAVKSGYVKPVKWDADESREDFREGKAARPGHISAGLDIRRKKWERKIQKGLNDEKVCVIRAPSGQGKSTLMFRYAYEHFDPETTFLLKTTRDASEVSAVVDFLETKSQLGKSLALLVDGADWRTREWVDVVQKCSALGFPAVVAVRNEDYHRYASRVAFRSHEVRPKLDFDEAKQIHAQLADADQLDAEAPTAVEGFERLGKPPLLMEFIYLLTQGELLRDRLKDQVRRIERSNEDPAKLQALRIVSLAHVLGAPVETERLLSWLDSGLEPRTLLEPLDEEYITGDAEFVEGLHWVRSDHLDRILHGKFQKRENTLPAVLSAVPDWAIAEVVTSALSEPDFDTAVVVEVIAGWSVEGGMDALLKVLDGCFDAGVRLYVQDNEQVFSDAFDLMGMSTVNFLAMAASVTEKGAEVLDGISEKVASKGVFPELLALREELGATLHFEYVDLVLEKLGEEIPSLIRESTPGELGRLLDWCHLVEFHVPLWGVLAPDVLARNNPKTEELEELAWFCQGLGRYDSARFRSWVDEHPELHARLRMETDALELRLSEERVEVEYPLIPTTDWSDLNGESVRRLQLLRRCFPISARYCSEGEQVIEMSDAVMSGRYNPRETARKAIPSENLSLPSDLDKNVRVGNEIKRKFQANSFHDYTVFWCRLRESVTDFLVGWARELRAQITGRRIRKRPMPDISEIGANLVSVPPIHPDAPEALRDLVPEASKWVSTIEKFFRHVTGTSPNYQRAAQEIESATDLLPKLGRFMSELESTAVEFECDVDPAEEQQAYVSLYEIFTAKAEGRELARRDVARLRRDRQKHSRAIATSIKKKLVSRLDGDPEIIVGERLYEFDELVHLAIAFDVPAAEALDVNLSRMLDHLPLNEDKLDFYVLIPTKDGARIIEEGIRVAAFPNTVGKAKAERERQWFTVPLQDVALNTLPSMSLKPVPRLAVLSLCATLQMTARTLKKWQELIARLEESGDPVDSALATAQRDELHSWLEESSRSWESDLADLREIGIGDRQCSVLDEAVTAFRKGEPDGITAAVEPLMSGLEVELQ